MLGLCFINFVLKPFHIKKLNSIKLNVVDDTSFLELVKAYLNSTEVFR